MLLLLFTLSYYIVLFSFVPLRSEQQPGHEEGRVPAVPHHPQQQPQAPASQGHVGSAHQGDGDLSLPPPTQETLSRALPVHVLSAGHLQHPRHLQGLGR